MEKYLKALLEEHTVPFPKTHDLLHLSKLVLPLGVRIGTYTLGLWRVSDYAVKFRYPGAFATAGQSREAVKILREIRGVLRQALGL